jgi:exodeoxyribonuclease-5
VLHLATDVRLGKPWGYERVNLAKAMEADQIIVWKNATRWNLINKIRAKLGRPEFVPVAGDRIMCLVNNHRDAGLLNGMQFEVLAVQTSALGYEIRALDEEGRERALTAYKAGFQGMEAEQEARKSLRAWKGRAGLFTFANAITCHKAQGSEWPHIYVVDQTPLMWKSTAEDKRRWAYTAISRASESVTIARTGA